MNLSWIAVQCGIAANNEGCKDGPQHLMQSTLFHSLDLTCHETVRVESPYRQKAALGDVASYCTILAEYTAALTQEKKPFVVIGGDHSCAIGTWSGVSHALHSPIGLLWIDAHLDSHTFETTESGNIHGMPVAVLLGHGEKALTHILSNHPKVDPRYMAFVGTRSYEKGEYDFIRHLGIRIFSMQDIQKDGLENVMKQALSIVRASPRGYGLSFDLDGVDPLDAPGVGVPEINGISGKELIKVLHLIRHDQKCLGTEIVEFNPHNDREQKTERLLCDAITAIYGE